MKKINLKNRIIKPLIIALVLVINYSCVLSNRNFDSQSKITKSDSIIFTSDTSLIDFLQNPEGCTERFSFGSLMNTIHSKDSINYLGFANFYNCKQTYEIVFLFKDIASRTETGNSQSEIFFNSKSRTEGYKDYQCYAFVYPQKDPDFVDDDKSIVFPLIVNAYKKIGKSTWEFRNEKKAKNVEELCEFQFEIIYGK